MNPSSNPELTLSRLLEKAKLGENYTSQIGAGALSPGSQSSSPALSGPGSGLVGAGTGAVGDPSAQRIIVGVDFGTTYSG